jgi:hypothetical protein
VQAIERLDEIARNKIFRVARHRLLRLFAPNMLLLQNY